MDDGDFLERAYKEIGEIYGRYHAVSLDDGGGDGDGAMTSSSTHATEQKESIGGIEQTNELKRLIMSWFWSGYYQGEAAERRRGEEMREEMREEYEDRIKRLEEQLNK